MTGYGCAYDDDCLNQINWLLTSMNPSFTISLCDDHLAPGVIPLLGANIGVDAGKLYESIKRFTDREAAREAREAEKTTDAPEVGAGDGAEATDTPRCEYCGEPLGDGESHLHGGQPNPEPVP